MKTILSLVSRETATITQLTTAMKSSLSTTGAALLLVSFSVACGSSGGTNPTDGGPQDGTSHADHETDGKTSKDGRSDGAKADGGMDGGNTKDSGDAHAGDAGTLLPVNLGTAGNYVILAKSGISNVPTSAVTGDLGISPAAATSITGFSLTLDSSKVFSTSSEVTGKVYASDYKPPTPPNLTTAVSDMQTAFTDAAGRAPNVTELGAGNIGGKTLTAGVYQWSTDLLIPTDVTLTGSATDVWIFQIAKTLNVSSATKVSLTGGAVSKNVFWQVSGAVDLGTTSQFEGVILGKTKIALKTGASINGRLMAQTAVTIDGSTIVEPAP